MLVWENVPSIVKITVWLKKKMKTIKAVVSKRLCSIKMLSFILKTFLIKKKKIKMIFKILINSQPSQYNNKLLVYHNKIIKPMLLVTMLKDHNLIIQGSNKGIIWRLINRLFLVKPLFYRHKLNHHHRTKIYCLNKIHLCKVKVSQ